MKYMVSILLKPILDIFLHSFSLSSHLQHSLKFLLVRNPMYLLKHVLNCAQNFSYFDLDYLTYGLTVSRLVRVYCTTKIYNFNILS